MSRLLVQQTAKTKPKEKLMILNEVRVGTNDRNDLCRSLRPGFFVCDSHTTRDFDIR